ncbi:MAG: hypothetical protein AAFR45_11550 [Pseudomonadota bacterium]
MSRHLKVLRKAGVIMQTVDKQRRIYSINPQAVDRLHDHASFSQDLQMAGNRRR